MRLIYPLLSILILSMPCYAQEQANDAPDAPAQAGTDGSQAADGSAGKTPQDQAGTPGSQPNPDATADADTPAYAPEQPPLVGVAKCDDLLKNMSDCAAKMPPEARIGLEGTIGTVRQSLIDRTKNKSVNLSEMCTNMASNAQNNASKSGDCKF